MRTLAWFVVLVAFAIAMPAAAQTTNCLDPGDEAHHSEIFRNGSVRILEFQLPRLTSSATHCHPYSFLTFPLTESRTTDGVMSHDWKPGEARFTYAPLTHAERNDQMALHREIEVETRGTMPNTRFGINANRDLFAGNPGDLKPTWSVSATVPGVTATRTQLAAGDAWEVNEPDHLLIALSDLELQKEGPSGTAKLSLSAGDTLILTGGSVHKLTNTSGERASFITVEF